MTHGETGTHAEARIVANLHERVGESSVITAWYHQRLAVVSHHVAEAENVRANDGSLARHGFEQRNPKRRFRSGARIDGAARVIARTSFEHCTSKDDIGVAAGEPVIVIAQRTIAHDHELGLS